MSQRLHHNGHQIQYGPLSKMSKLSGSSATGQCSTCHRKFDHLVTYHRECVYLCCGFSQCLECLMDSEYLCPKVGKICKKENRKLPEAKEKAQEMELDQEKVEEVDEVDEENVDPEVEEEISEDEDQNVGMKPGVRTVIHLEGFKHFVKTMPEFLRKEKEFWSKNHSMADVSEDEQEKENVNNSPMEN